MGHHGDTRIRSDVFEVSVPIVLEEKYPTANGRDHEVLSTVVFDVTKSRSHAHEAGQRDRARLRGDVLELALPQILPQLIPSNLVQKKNVVEPIAIHIRDSHRAAVIVVCRLVVLFFIIHGLITKGDAALLHRVGKVETVKDLELVLGGELFFLALGQRLNPNVVRWDRDVVHLRSGRTLHSTKNATAQNKQLSSNQHSSKPPQSHLQNLLWP